jgi:hypothetical protein
MRTNINLNYLLKKCVSNFKITSVSAVLSLLITLLLFFNSETKVVLKNSFYISKILYVTLLSDDPILMQFALKNNELTNQNNNKLNQNIDFLKYNSAIKLTDTILDSYASKIKYGIVAEKKKITDIVEKKDYQIYFNSEQETKNDNIIQFELKKNFKKDNFENQDFSDVLLVNKEVKEIVYQIILDQVRTIDKNFNQNLDNYIFHTYIVNKIPFSYYRYISTYVFLLIFINFIIVFIKYRKKILI